MRFIMGMLVGAPLDILIMLILIALMEEYEQRKLTAEACPELAEGTQRARRGSGSLPGVVRQPADEDRLAGSREKRETHREQKGKQRPARNST